MAYDYEYSDEINIRSAKKNLKTLIRSASALPIRPTSLSGVLHPETIFEESGKSRSSSNGSVGTVRRNSCGVDGRETGAKMEAGAGGVGGLFSVGRYKQEIETDDNAYDDNLEDDGEDDEDYLEIGDTRLDLANSDFEFFNECVIQR
ncbi:unnamed protein product [Ambrosiozyma monospora]|uniref:Unnamed protein product n=1 Tax=Ambrosiozyma monospora TaxID=43982 RepID=A0ACB5UCJ1_AMBMO|nr:unnamed protein product [Ambrosiozyma monospora]